MTQNEINAHAAALGVSTDATANATPAAADSPCCGDSTACVAGGSGPLSEAGASVTNKSCGECHWWRNGKQAIYGVLGDCEHPRSKAQLGNDEMYSHEGYNCPTFRQRGERLPQRFRYRETAGGEWLYGCCFPYTEDRDECWHGITEQGGHCYFDHKTEVDQDVLSATPRAVEFEWIDNDFGWSGK